MSIDERRRDIERYAAGPARLRAAVAAAPTESLKWRPAPGEFSIHEVVCHCADSETNAHMRIRYLLAEKDPQIIGYDQEQWAREFDYHEHPLDTALATVDAVRANTAALIRRVPDDAWERAGTHTELGRYTAATWLKLYAAHLEEHAEQIERTLAAWRERGV